MDCLFIRLAHCTPCTKYYLVQWFLGKSSDSLTTPLLFHCWQPYCSLFPAKKSRDHHLSPFFANNFSSLAFLLPLLSLNKHWLSLNLYICFLYGETQVTKYCCRQIMICWLKKFQIEFNSIPDIIFSYKVFFLSLQGDYFIIFLYMP